MADVFTCDPPGPAWKVVPDIGCNAGFYSIEMKKRRADHVVGIDPDLQYLAQGRFAAEVCGTEIEFRQLSVYEVDKLHEIRETRRLSPFLLPQTLNFRAEL